MRAYSKTDTGRRKIVNQDCLFVSETPVGNLPNLFLLADGMGGHNRGDFASKHAIEVVLEDIRNNSQYDPKILFEQAYQKAHLVLKDIGQKDKSFQGMGTTLIAMSIIGRFAYIANIGDSRAYLINYRQGKIRQITKDHSYVQALVDQGILNPKEAKKSPDRHKITQAVGVNSQIKVDLFEVMLAPQFELFLCSDGLSNMLEDDTILQIAQKYDNLEDRVKHLIEEANRKGGEDNISLIAVSPFQGEELRC